MIPAFHPLEPTAAFAALANRLGPIKPPVTLVVCGSAAGLLTHLLAPARLTGDCDIVGCEPEESWVKIQAAAAVMAPEFRLSETWLNRKAERCLWKFALGWERRLVAVHDFGSLRIKVISRRDLIAAKVMAARMQDVEDLLELRPTREELDFAAANLERQVAESLDRDEFPKQHAVLNLLRQNLRDAQAPPGGHP